ncbi:isopentenyl-diphosphate delta-isomerase [Corynebacterium atypicum]|uniref:Isopentenyl-diphosphate Delta-isomerase n=1 Tax=Corynebacterium atypicum TaxID=191610 RepID=A0ABM5QP56_9CORY|nr:isopentenyl-diphosphate Delta-isomerase [Corynebacterium atypicum]AIG64523.1 isopentenyl-diphosphate delta-isomerase [Corynebacterium atypicum]
MDSSHETEELVVLVGADGRPAGTAPKATVHTADTPLHFAFSAYVLDPEGRLLLTRRALSKRTWPGVWTNSFCGHPGPGEITVAAVRRRASEELGLQPAQLGAVEEVLPDFSYRATDSSGIVEYEVCPVFVVRLTGPVALAVNPEEVDAWVWAAPADVVAAARALPEVFSQWMVAELADPRLVAALG